VRPEWTVSNTGGGSWRGVLVGLQGERGTMRLDNAGQHWLQALSLTGAAPYQTSQVGMGLNE
jgi:hypothetical protein